MLKLVRRLAIDNPLVLKIIMAVVALTFVISMGWWGIKAPGTNIVAEVDGYKIKAIDYRRAYNNAIDYYRRAYGNKFNADLLKKLKVKDKVLEDLIVQKLWLEEARKLGLKVSDEELRKHIMQIQAFHNENGEFDSKIYRAVLEANHMTVAGFEEAQRESLLIDKIKRLVRDTVHVSNEEVKTLYPGIKGKGKKKGTKKAGQELSKKTLERLKKFLRFQKQEKAVQAYAARLRQRAKIKINKNLL